MTAPLDILYLGDQEFDLPLIRQVLEPAFSPVAIRPVLNASSLVPCLAGDAPDAILVEDRLSWDDRRRLLAALRDHFPRTPIVVFLSGEDEETLLEAARGEVAACFRKSPRGLHQLPQIMRAVLTRETAPGSELLSGDPGRLLEASGLGVFTASFDGRLREGSGVFREMLALSADGILTTFNLREFAAAPGGMAPALDQLALHGEVRRSALNLRRADGEAVLVSMTAVTLPMRSGGSLILGVLAPLSIQSPSNVARESVGISEETPRLERFVSMATHELQEPLRTLERHVRLLSREMEGRPTGSSREHLQSMIEGTTRMRALVEDILLYSRSLTRENEIEEINCEELLGRVAGMLSAAIAESGAAVTHDPLPIVLADRDRLFSVFQNLIGNAIKYRGADYPRIHVSAIRKDSAWQFQVKDNGCGIPADEMERIFEPFTRLHTQDEIPGTGIGLTITRQIITSHGGRIWVKSEPGKGTTFCFTLPLRREPAVAAVEGRN